MRTQLIRAVAFLGVLVLCAVFFRDVKFREVQDALTHADLRLVAAALLLGVVNLVTRMLRWAVLLQPLPHRGAGASLRQLFSLLLASIAASNVLPGRVGEALRTVEPHRRHGYPVAGLVAAQLIEKAIEGLSMALIAAATLGLARAGTALYTPVLLLGGLGVGSTVLALLVAFGYPRWRPLLGPSDAAVAASLPWFRRIRLHLLQFLARFTEAVHLMHSPRIWGQSFVHAFLSDVVDVGMLALCLLSVGIHIGPTGWLLTYLSLNLTLLIPATPGQLGVHEMATVMVLTALGVDKTTALAAAIVYHAIHFVPTTLIGLFCLRTQVESLGRGALASPSDVQPSRDITPSP